MKLELIPKYEKLKEIVSEMIQRAGSGHYASSVSALQIMVPLFYEQKINLDQFILSKGHAAPALYAVLHDLGYLSERDLKGFRQHGGLPGHPELGINGILCSSGSLGMGISKAMGLAYINPSTRYHVLVGDGELQEGQNHEAIGQMLDRLVDNVMIHIDCNGMQYSGPTGPLRMGKLPFSDKHIIFHYTEWEHDNHYLTGWEPQELEYTHRLLKAMEADPKLIVLNADLEQDFGLTPIKKSFPERYIQCGISEQHMVSMANGLALAGMVPICHTFGAFYRRAVDQMYNNVCDKIGVGYVAGLCRTPAKNIGMSHAASDSMIFAHIGVETFAPFEEFFDLIKHKSVYIELS